MFSNLVRFRRDSESLNEIAIGFYRRIIDELSYNDGDWIGVYAGQWCDAQGFETG
jgi:hypothetical protein